MSHPIRFRYRPKTQDEMMIKEVYFDNCYHLPRQFEPEDLVLDIGAHIGSFSLACLERGCQRLWAYEPAPENHRYLLQNLRDSQPRWPLAKWEVRGEAVTAYDYDESHRRRFYYTGDQNSACGHLVGHRDEVTPTSYFVDTVTFAEAVKRALDQGESASMIRFCKMDIEGEEIPILMQADQPHMRWALDRIVELAFEYHADIFETLKLKLEEAGFEDIALDPVHPAIPLTQQGLLFARHTAMLYGNAEVESSVEQSEGPQEPRVIVPDGLISKVIHHGKDERAGVADSQGDRGEGPASS